MSLLRISGEIFVSAIQRHRAEAALRGSEQRHRVLFERNLAGVYRNTSTAASSIATTPWRTSSAFSRARS